MCAAARDNVLYGYKLTSALRAASAATSCAAVFTDPLTGPQHFGVVENSADGRLLSIEEKPARPRSRLAVTEFYDYDSQVVDFAAALRPSACDQLDACVMGRGHAWLDTGTHESLIEASRFIPRPTRAIWCHCWPRSRVRRTRNGDHTSRCRPAATRCERLRRASTRAPEVAC